MRALLASAAVLGLAMTVTAAAQQMKPAPEPSNDTRAAAQAYLGAAKIDLAHDNVDGAKAALAHAAAPGIPGPPEDAQTREAIKQARIALWFGNNTAQARYVIDGALGVNVQQAEAVPTGPNATPLDYLKAARTALANDRSDEAMEALAKADTGASGPMAQQIGQARTALWFGDNTAQASHIVDGVLAENKMSTGSGTATASGSTGAASSIGSSGESGMGHTSTSGGASGN
jgi:hypothetical protein